MSLKKHEFLNIDLTPQRTSSFLSNNCGKISFRTPSIDDEVSPMPFKSDESTIKQYFNNFKPQILTNVNQQDDYYEISLPEDSRYIIYSQPKPIDSSFEIEKEILYISLEKLIEILASSNDRNDEIFQVCLYGYLSFSDDETIFKELIKRFNVYFPINTTKSEKIQIYNQKIFHIQRKIMAFLQYWIEIYKETVVLNKRLDGLFEETLFSFYFYRKEYSETYSVGLSKLLINLEEVRVYKNFKKFNETNLNSFKNAISSALTDIIFPVYHYILNEPQEIVEQICIFDYDNFYRISIPELLKKKTNGGDNYNYFAKNFNNISKIISFILLWMKSSSKRINFFEKVLETIDNLIKYNNYSTSFACFLSLTHTSIERLNNILFKKISKKHKNKYESLARLFTTTNNHNNLREAQKHMNPPCVPFLGIYVKDLLNYEENSKLNNGCKVKHMIDYKKASQISAVLREIDNYKETWYEFEKNDRIYEYFKYLPDVPDDLLYELSYKLLPSN